MARRNSFLLVASFLTLPALGIALSGLGMQSGGALALAHGKAQSRDAQSGDAQSGDAGQAESPAGPAKLAGDADFKARCHGPGVVRCIGFDSRSDISGHTDPDASGVYSPEIDTTVSASGRGSMKFTVPAFSKSNSSGQYWTNISDDLSVQFDSLVNGDPKSKFNEFYVQWRQRFSPEMLVPFKGSNGWKQAIIGEGDRPDHRAYSCTDIDVVLENSGQLGMPRMYHSCGAKDDQYDQLSINEGADATGSYAWSPQNAAPPAGKCRLVPGFRPKFPPCIGYKANQWMTFQIHVKVGTWYEDNSHKYHHDSTVQLWVAEEGKPSAPVIDFSPENKTGYDLVNTAMGKAKFGKIWFLPYQTNKDSEVPHDKAYTWYDELIISRERIPDPK